eukprot:c18987_g1_i1.p2 GENE.c18987_g1_i1~~c18987_g1_i1.p2  ORF type:complete len:149 (+),score=39.25 c18987_g1_i1:757-1203(+)
MVGLPRSGKTTFVQKFFGPWGYTIVSRENLKTEAKCKAAVVSALEEGKSVVVDNTNPGPDKRAVFTKLAGKIPVRCFVMKTPRDVCEHNNKYRETFHGIPHVPRVGFAMFEKLFVDPTRSEGFGEIVAIEFVPEFQTKIDRENYCQFT